MSLTAALNSARSSLSASSVQSSVISRNIAGASADGYSRKLAVLDNLPGAGVYVAAIQRAASSGLYDNVLIATSSSAKQTAIFDGLQKIAASTVDDPELDQSPTAQLNALKQALQKYANAPDNTTLAQAAVAAFDGPGGAFSTMDELLATLRNELSAPLHILVKGSRRMRMERVIAALKMNPEAGDLH